MVTRAVEQRRVNKRFKQKKTTSISDHVPFARQAATKLSGANTPAGFRMLATTSYTGHSFSVQKRNHVSVASLLTLNHQFVRLSMDGGRKKNPRLEQNEMYS